MVSSLVPQNLWHRDRRGGDVGREREKDPVRYGLNSISDSVIGQAVAKLRFTKDGAGKYPKNYNACLNPNMELPRRERWQRLLCQYPWPGPSHHLHSRS